MQLNVENSHPKMEDNIYKTYNSGVVYKFKYYYCESSYIGQTSMHLQTWINEHILRCARNHIKSPIKPMSIATTNAINTYTIAERLINNIVCERN